MPDDFEIRVRVKDIGPIPTTTVAHDLTGVRFPKHEPWVNLEGAVFREVDFSGHTFKPFNGIGATFERCNFRRTAFRSGGFGELRTGTPPTRYIDCNFDGSRIGSDMEPGNARFERCTFVGAKIRGWRDHHAEFIDCTFASELESCWFTGSTDLADFAQRQRNEFRGNDFSQANLVRCQFDYGIDMFAQRWPTDPDYVLLDRIDDRIRSARLAVSRWPVDAEREAALGRLSRLEDQAAHGQRALLLRRSEFLTWIPVVRDQLVALLERDPDSPS